jgi:hypothetical protein
MKSGSLNFLEPSGPVKACNGIALPYLVKPEILTSYVYGLTFGNAETRLFLFAAQCFKHWINAESFPVSQLCVNTLLATKITLITDGI